ncbi:uncharacterized protein DEA37_0010556 [Paragonimus westermani]|uniref:Uncharacterized protein n=1 Tax=Paragonimus westermani TaxID=34504 RepID=A0A5J4P0F2_9TREM|nr:uncharacterized protein DEA37_0010556 [Paragonimus westermani]
MHSCQTLKKPRRRRSSLNTTFLHNICLLTHFPMMSVIFGGVDGLLVEDVVDLLRGCFMRIYSALSWQYQNIKGVLDTCLFRGTSGSRIVLFDEKGQQLGFAEGPHTNQWVSADNLYSTSKPLDNTASYRMIAKYCCGSCQFVFLD